MNQTFDLIDRARDYLRSHGIPDATAKRLDSFTGKEGTVVRLLSEKTVCRLAADVLDGAELPSDSGAYTFIDQEVASHANEIELDESLFYAWEVRIRANITIQR